MSEEKSVDNPGRFESMQQEAAVILEITVDPLTVDTAGTDVIYTYIITNNGNELLTGVTVNDNDFGEIALDFSILEPSETASVTRSYEVTQMDINSGDDIVNTATVTTLEGATDDTEVTLEIIKNPSVLIEKTADKESISSGGEVITYNYTVTNDGNVTLNNITVEDDPLGTITMNTATLAPKEATEGTADYEVTLDDVITGGVIYNEATVTTDEGAADVAEVSVTIVQDASVQLEKTASKQSVSSEEIITYTFLVTNDGTATLNNISVTDNMLGPVTMNATTLAPGADTNGSAAYTVTLDDINSGLAIVNEATVTTDEGATDVAEASVTVVQDPSVQLDKTADKQNVSLAGEVITYTYTVTNDGNVTLNNIVVVDDKLDEITLNETTLAPGAGTDGTATYIVTLDDINSGSDIVNEATVNTDEGVTAVAEASVSVTQDASLQIEKTADKQSVSSEGEVITYNYLVTNDGNVTLNNILVTDDQLGTITMDVTLLAPGETAEGTAAYTVTQADINSGNDIVNVATVTTDEGVSNNATAKVTIDQQSELGIIKTATTNSFNEVGDIINYNIEVTNSGNVTLDVNVSDPLTGMDETLNDFAPGSSQTFTTSYTVQQSDLNAGSVTNIATASDGNTLTVSDEATVSGTMSPGVSIIKTASPTTYSIAGTIINYEIVVENTGNVNLTNVVVEDQMLNLNETVGELVPGASVSFDGTYIITQFDLNNGTLSNTAFVSGNAPDGENVSDQDRVIVSANQNPDLVVDKTASPITYDSVGDEITYTITVENSGNVILTDVVVSDPLTGMDETIAILAPGESPSFTQTLTINQEHLNSGSLVNTVSVSGNGPGNITVSDTDDAIITAFQSPGLSVNKTASQETYTTVGEEIGYTIEVENTGNIDLTNVTVVDPLIQMNESTGTLNPGEIRSFSAAYNITGADMEEGIVINTVVVTGTYGNETIEADAEAVVTALFPPVANDDISADQITGNAAVIPILENDLLNDGSPAIPGLVTVDLNQQVEGVQSRLEIQGEGTWVYNSQSGELTYTPQSGFTTDPTAISYMLTENSTGLSDEASVTVDYNEGEPFAFNDVSTDNIPGEPVTINILANDKLSDGSPASSQQVTIDVDIEQAGIQTERVVAGEGTWGFNPATGELVFTPIPGFSTDPAPLTYMLIENLTDLSDEGTVIIGYDEQPPVAADDSSSGHAPGEVVTLNLLENDFLGDGTQAKPERITIDIDLTRAGIQDEFDLSGEGLWSLNPSTGMVTFTPVTGFTGNPEPITYRLTEVLTGLADTATITFIYNEEAPVAADDISSDNEPGSEVIINILENDRLSDGSPAEPQLVLVDFDDQSEGLQHEIIVEAQGTWIYNEVTGTLTFSPQTGFFDDPSPVSYTLCSIWNPQVCSEAEVIIDFQQDASLASVGFIKTGTYISEEEEIYYSFEVQNTGNLPVWDIAITDERIGIENLFIVPDTLQPGATGTASATYQVVLADKNVGYVENSAVAAGLILNGERIEDISGSTVNDDDPTVTSLPQDALISVRKQFLMEGMTAALNDNVDFSITVKNDGNVVLNSVRIEDPLTGFKQEEGELFPGDSVVYYTTYTVQPEDELNGEFVNTAIATATAPGGYTVVDSSIVAVDVEQCEMVIPNGFSPNEDGIQDVWRITCLEKYPNARVEIFNRWGNQVFQKNAFGNTGVHGIADAWWDGSSTSKRTFGSGKLPAGTYYYILYLQNGQEPLNGYIFLNR